MIPPTRTSMASVIRPAKKDLVIAQWKTPALRHYGAYGDGPLFASCAGCGQRDSVIAGHIALRTAPEFPVLVRLESGGWDEGVYCESCFARFWPTDDPRDANPVPDSKP